MKVAQSCLTLWPHYRVHGILQARIPEWVAFPFSRGSSQPRDWTQASHIAGGFFISWATREAQGYWSGWPILSPADLPNPGVEPGSPALQVDSFTNWAIREACTNLWSKKPLGFERSSPSRIPCEFWEWGHPEVINDKFTMAFIMVLWFSLVELNRHSKSREAGW